MDEQTEVLTVSGWRKVNNIRKGEVVYGRNIDGTLQLGHVDGVRVHENYADDIYEYSSDKLSFCVTAEHNFVGFDRRGAFIGGKPSVFFGKSRPTFVRSGCMAEEGRLDLPDDHLRLYICLAADGSICNTDLGRLRVKRGYKLKYFRDLLNSMSIKYSDNDQKDGSISLNFTIPEKIMKLNIKGLDSKILQIRNKEQIKIILEAYAITDGYLNNKTYCIYSAKEQEVDLLQHLFVVNGHMVKKSARYHGFGKNPQYTLNVTAKELNVFSRTKDVILYQNKDKSFWHVSTDIGTFFCRREGSVYLAGGC